MKKIIKIILILISIITFLILIDIFTMTVTVRKVTKDIKTVEGSKESLDSDTSEIYCKYITGGEIGDWAVIGKDGVLFNNDNKEREEIIVIGNIPSEMNYSILGNNIFVFEGEYLGVKKKKGYNYDFKIFKAENWFIKYPIERISVDKYHPKDGLSLADIIAGQSMPVREMMEYEN